MKKDMYPTPTPPAKDAQGTPAYTGPQYPDYNRLGTAAQSPGQREARGAIRSLAEIFRSPTGAALTGGVVVPVTTLNSDGSVTPSLSIPVSGNAIFISQSNAANVVSGAGFRLKKNNNAITDWISLITVLRNQDVMAKPVSPFAGPDTGYVVNVSRVVSVMPYNIRVLIDFDTVEFYALFSAFTVNALIAQGDAKIDFF